jgi:threonine/homoserine/homoserine lactone efflux protein
MTDLATFALGAIALLATPGPTNTLLATAGATRGIKASLPLLLAEAAGYVLAILGLRTLVGPLMATEPVLANVLSAIVCVYLVYLSWKLWRTSSLPVSTTSHISFGSVFVTTLLNPKAIVFAFTLLPGDVSPAALAPWFSALIMLIALCGGCWISFGAALTKHAGEGPRMGYRAGAAALFTLALLLGARAAGIT